MFLQRRNNCTLTCSTRVYYYHYYLLLYFVLEIIIMIIIIIVNAFLSRYAIIIITIEIYRRLAPNNYYNDRIYR